MQVSIIIASHNEGALLRQTVQSCLDSIRNLEYEIVVADDGSTDGSIEQVLGLPRVRIVRQNIREGPAGGKDLGARFARGNVLVFLDAHCKPEPGAIGRLVVDIGLLGGRAIVAPRIAALDVSSWQNNLDQCGNGIAVDLGSFEERWVPLATLRRYRDFYLSPNLAGSCLAVSRKLYFELGGFDRQMRYWGSEHSDFGLTAWMLGYRVVNDINAVVGHRFRRTFENYSVPAHQIVVNQLRMARKHFTNEVWSKWLVTYRNQQEVELWSAAWRVFTDNQEALEQERNDLHRRRVRDEFWYSNEFGMSRSLGIALAESSATPVRRRLTGDCIATSPRNRSMADADAAGISEGDDGCRLTIEMKIGTKVWGGPYIEHAVFAAEGDTTLQLYAGLLLEMIDGRTLETVSSIAPQDLLRQLGGDASEAAKAELTVDAFRKALREVGARAGAADELALDFESRIGQAY